MTAAATHGSVILQVNLRDVAGNPTSRTTPPPKDDGDRPLSLTSAARSWSENRSGSADSTRKDYGAALARPPIAY
jgi:hypothetical protein